MKLFNQSDLKLRLFLILALFNNFGCGRHPQSDSSHTILEEYHAVKNIDDDLEGQYLAVFETINPSITKKINGSFTFSREKTEDEVVVDVRVTNSGTKIIHSQHIRLGKRCPESSDDINQDGVIDEHEGQLVYGKIFIPLDGDISSQSSHDGEFPVSDEYGRYIYSRFAKFSLFIQDLRSEQDINYYEKLKANEPLEIIGKAIVVNGIEGNNNLPIACGIIEKVLASPGEIEEQI
jgi:hypothetical protein